MYSFSREESRKNIRLLVGLNDCAKHASWPRRKDALFPDDPIWYWDKDRRYISCEFSTILFIYEHKIEYFLFHVKCVVVEFPHFRVSVGAIELLKVLHNV